MLCLTAGTVSAMLAVQSFTLSWVHSIEKIQWQEDWRVDARELVIDEARIRGTGAGMEPPDNAVLKDGIWRYQPAVTRHQVLRLTHSPYAQGYEICTTLKDQFRCQPLVNLLPAIDNNAVIELRPCE
jgi:hypothetical protein